MIDSKASRCSHLTDQSRIMMPQMDAASTKRRSSGTVSRIRSITAFHRVVVRGRCCHLRVLFERVKRRPRKSTVSVEGVKPRESFEKPNGTRSVATFHFAPMSKAVLRIASWMMSRTLPSLPRPAGCHTRKGQTRGCCFVRECPPCLVCSL